jgi:hypothetical protein
LPSTSNNDTLIIYQRVDFAAMQNKSAQKSNWLNAQSATGAVRVIVEGGQGRQHCHTQHLAFIPLMKYANCVIEIVGTLGILENLISNMKIAKNANIATCEHGDVH